MPRMRDLLQRWRPTAAPGAASTGGVPADRAADLAVELRPIFAVLATTQKACRLVVEDGAEAAEQTMAEGRERARVTRESAAGLAAAARAEAASKVRRRSEDETREREQEARRSADRVRERSRELLPRYVEMVVAAVGLR